MWYSHYPAAAFAAFAFIGFIMLVAHIANPKPKKPDGGFHTWAEDKPPQPDSNDTVPPDS
jgi:hypothetical protein